MEVTFDTVGELKNELGKQWENKDFKCATSITVTPDILETELTRVYSIVGYIPNKLTIDNSGVISGVLGLLDKQKADLPRNPLKPIGIDGTNWQNDGSVKVPLHIFNFKIKVIITYRDDDVIRVLKTPNKLLEVLTQVEIDEKILLPVEAVKTFIEEDINIKNAFDLDSVKTIEVISEDVGIKIIKNNNLANTRFVLRYMQAGHTMSIGDESYGLNRIHDFLSKNPNTFEALK